MLMKMTKKDRKYISKSTSYTLLNGEICGVNIKRYARNLSYDPKKGKGIVDKWGLFIHIRCENGSQYDFVLNAGKISRFSNMVPPYKETNGVVIPRAIYNMGVTELVELFGLKVVVRVFDNNKFIVHFNHTKDELFLNTVRGLYPHRYEVIENKFTEDEVKHLK